MFPVVWFLLVDSASGLPYKGTTADKVSVASSADVADFRKAIKAKNSNMLSSVDADELLVYKNKSSFDKRNAAVDEGKEEPLNSSCPLDGLGETEEEKDMLVVVVPSSRSSSRSTSASGLTRKEPNPKRKQRWIELNRILEANAKKSKTNDSTAYSSIAWYQIDNVIYTTKYVQPRRHMDNSQLSFFAQYLSMTTHCFRGITTGKDSKRLHFIAPVLMSVCILLDGDVEIVVEEDLVGNFVKAHSHFEFMLRRGNKAVCIVTAKRGNFDQGLVQCFIGCEVAAEVKGLDTVYGIVTDYIAWLFVRSLDDKVESEECSLRITPNGPHHDSLKEIAEKIYAMLS
ncbi:hypothetical protein HDU67_001654 [Dinochytrium kinnereticum]|nr:hypothetical protein HDU67_001654 [Dinochytrium kinnereticum]